MLRIATCTCLIAIACSRSGAEKHDIVTPLKADEIARVGDTVIGVDLVRDIMAEAGVTPPMALKRLNEDALLANEATRRGVEGRRDFIGLERAIKARVVARRLADQIALTNLLVAARERTTPHLESSAASGLEAAYQAVYQAAVEGTSP